MKHLTKSILFAACFACLMMAAEVASACPTCKDGMAGDPAYSNMVNGYFWSIIFMMSMPFLVFTGVAGYFYYEVRRAKARQKLVSQATLQNELPDEDASLAGSADIGPSPDIALQS